MSHREEMFINDISTRHKKVKVTLIFLLLPFAHVLMAPPALEYLGELTKKAYKDWKKKLSVA